MTFLVLKSGQFYLEFPLLLLHHPSACCAKHKAVEASYSFSPQLKSCGQSTLHFVAPKQPRECGIF